MKRSSVPRCPWHPVLHGPMRLMSAYPTWVCPLCDATTPDPYQPQPKRTLADAEANLEAER